MLDYDLAEIYGYEVKRLKKSESKSATAGGTNVRKMCDGRNQ